jgi:hypothetical protein
MIIYRIEDKNGFGYKKDLETEISNATNMGFMGTYLQDEDLYFKYRPMPDNDGIKSSLIRRYHLFGFSNLNDLNSWFLPADLVMGTILLAKLCIYDVNKNRVIFGGKQVIFDKRKARLIHSLPMSHFLDKNFQESHFDFKEIETENYSFD